MDGKDIQGDAVNFIRQLDEAAFEAFTRGECTGEKFREIAQEIAEVQRLTQRILSDISLPHFGAGMPLNFYRYTV